MGYHFVGWDTDFTNITNNLDVRPIYEPNTDTPYTINYYKEAIGGLTYELYESVIFYGTSDALVDATFNTYEGFIFNTNHVDKKLSGYVAVDGSLTLNLYYDRVQYDVHFYDIRIVRIDTSNKAGGSNVNQGKQWSIIFERPTDLKLEDLKTFKDLQEKSGYIKVTQRVNYPNQYGIRIYNMSKNPDVKILGNVFDYLFD